MVSLMNNIQNQHILKSMPLMASILGDKYGVEVVIGGDNAMTDGNIIYLPSLPLECDDTFLALLRGFADHESAHIRYSDFELIKNAVLTDFEHFVWNCIEDWRIEQLIANHFSGCKVNLHWLIHHIFIKMKKKSKHANLRDVLAEWILLSVRSWDVEELRSQVNHLERKIDKAIPQLCEELRYILSAVQKYCKSTKDAMGYAKAIVSCIDRYIN